MDDRHFGTTRRLLSSLTPVELGGYEVAVQAALNYRKLRRIGYTIGKTIDVVIASRCILSDLELQHDDRAFEPFSLHLGLRCVA